MDFKICDINNFDNKFCIPTSPSIELIRDDFPDPMAPATPIKSPGLMERFTSRNT